MGIEALDYARFASVKPPEDYVVASDQRIWSDLMFFDLIKFGSFHLYSGQTSPIYIDLRSLISFPDLLRGVANRYLDTIVGLGEQINRPIQLCGVPMGAISISLAISMAAADRFMDLPSMLLRTTVKQHGTGGVTSGYIPGSELIVIDDLVTSGASIEKVLKVVREHQPDLIPFLNHTVVLIDRMQGGKENLDKLGMKLHSLWRLPDMLAFYNAKGMITHDQYEQTMASLNPRI